jgi:hypothetical protein
MAMVARLVSLESSELGSSPRTSADERRPLPHLLELIAQPLTIGEVHLQRDLELREQFPRLSRVVAKSYKLMDQT